MNRPIKYQQDIESALGEALLREEKLKAQNKKLRKDIFEMNDKCVAMRSGLQAKVKRLEEEVAVMYDEAQAENVTLMSKNEQLQAELEKHRWIPVSERLPKYIEGLNQSKPIFILDDKLVYIGDYYNGKFEYWSGSWCNTDEPASQKAITHWKPIILPEQAVKESKDG